MTTPRPHAELAALYFADDTLKCWVRCAGTNSNWVSIPDPTFSDSDLEYFVGHEPPPPKPAEQTVTDALRLAVKSAAPYSTATVGVSRLNEAADTIDTLRAQLDKLTAENEQLREQRNRIGLYIDRALNGGKKDDHEAGLSGRMDAIRALRTQLAEAQAAQTINQYPPITTEMIYQHVQTNQARHFLRVSWKDGIDIEEPTHSVEYLLHAYADAAREGWSSPEEVRTLRAAIDAAKEQT